MPGNPLAQFQYARLEEGEIQNVIAAINRHLHRPLSDLALQEAFELWWPKLEEKIGSAKFQIPEGKRKKGGEYHGDSDEVRVQKLESAVNELLHLTRRFAFDKERELELMRPYVKRRDTLSEQEMERRREAIRRVVHARPGLQNEDGKPLGDILGEALGPVDIH